MPAKKKKTMKKPSARRATKTVSKKKGTKYCRKCHYCDEGTVFRHCLRCGNCFCEYHAEAVGYCDQCGSGKKKVKKTGKPKKRTKR
jgi:hypothetical protein